ncbi:exopolygalacturonase-like [Corylus avellana]|uniref:exopolygalacturonase-like n=1 Tax=Corylus avellana TaxID=13451 RepID=UPI001E1FA338|nr:exopolygalacturonase-like [Corylus avellana]
MAISGGACVLAILLLAFYRARGLEESQIAFPPGGAAVDAPAFSPGGADDQYALPPGGAGDAPAFSPGGVGASLIAVPPVGWPGDFALPPGGAGDAPAYSPGGADDAYALPPGGAGNAPAYSPGGADDAYALPPGGAAGAPALSPPGGAGAYNELADDDLFDTQGVSDTFANSLNVVKPQPRRGRNFDIPDPSEKIFNVLQFGAKSDGKKDCAQAFIKAWRATCDFNGKARLVIPGGTFLLSQVVFGGPCIGPAPKIVQVVGNLKATTDISEYSSPEWFLFESISGLVIIGPGTFDGQGDAVWEYNDCKSNQNCAQLPSNIKLIKVKNAIVRGISSVNSKGKHLFITMCEKIRIQKLHLTAPEDSPNTDGIHISNTNDVRIVQTNIATGDDCIAIIAGATNVFVNRLTCGPGHGISVGSLGKYPDEKDVRGITVSDCTFTGTDNGVRIKTWPGSPPSAASGMLFQNLIMNNVRFPIIIDQEYCSSKTCSNKGTPSRVQISNVHYINVRGTSTTAFPVKLMCSKQFPCKDVQLTNIDLRYNGSPATSTCDNAKVRYSGRQNPPPCK